LPAARAKRRTTAHAGRAAVVDIGSNSIRLVIFTGRTRAPFTLFNEKVLCGLGRGLDATGRLNDAGVALALENLSRFVRLAKAMGASRIDLLGTAAVRDADNGRQFAAEVKRRCGVGVRILSGEEEARLSAQGVLSGIPEADGVMGDLGGGSVEIVAIRRGKIGRHATLPLGPVRLLDSVSDDGEGARELIDRHLAKIDWIEDVRGRTFYPVGGAWRTLARIHMDQIGYPLHVIHHYAIARREAEDLARVISRLGKRSLASIPGLSRRRVETLPFAALLLERVLRLARPDRVVFSAFGLREGYVFADLPAREKAQDPLISACAEFAEAEGRFGDIGALLQDWIEPLFRRDKADRRRLRLAACTLSDVGWREHPDYRAEQVFTRILRLPISGIDHPGRVAIALAIYLRYGGDPGDRVIQPVLGMLAEEQRQYWEAVGLAMRLAYSLSAATPDLLRRTGIKVAGGKLRLRLDRADRLLNGEAVERRLEALHRAIARLADSTEGGRGRSLA
jgi:exopolyphosphatase/guanosine-5'-triphosphate,3'-diphosphate pyrophosphatase